MHAVIFAGGTLNIGQATQAALTHAELIIAADGGAASALQQGFIPDIIVGDFDSLDSMLLEQLQTSGSQVIRVATEKDETDTELAIQAALERGATEISLLGGLGGERFDHTMANILLLAGFETTSIRIIDGPSVCWLLRGPGTTSIDGQKDDLLSLLPLTAEAIGVRTSGLYYPLHGESLRFGKPRGVSNVFIDTHATVALENGLLLIIHTNVQELKQAAL